MGTIFSTRVFFGTFVPRSSKLGQVLDRYIVQHGGTPAPAAQGIVISRSGSEEATFITVETDVSRTLPQPWARELDERHAHISQPAALPSAPPEWSTRVTLFLANEAHRFTLQEVLDELSPIGFHVAATRM